MRTRARLVPMLAPLLLLALAGCSSTVALPAATDATDPACARVIVALPDTVAGLDARETNAQGTGAWGDPAFVILRCGVASPPPTSTSPCLAVDGIDWIRDDSKDPNFTFTTYGRTPAVEVLIDSDGDPEVENDGVSGLEALSDLSAAVGVIPQTSKCISISDAG
ncbi:MAG: DUF3515 domain-containing protein [Salinibacterium sp.]|nr:DUF3515 domain-containing protein [Salinibacterium sp.]